MKLTTSFVIIFLYNYCCFTQTESEILLFDLSQKNGIWQIENGNNISTNKGYDNQPYFYNDNSIIYASTRNGQTDIIQYNLLKNTKTFISDTPDGGEYSPQRIPSSNSISAVRLDTNGKQNLYQYNVSNGEIKTLVPNLVVAYPRWYTKNRLAASVIENDALVLYLCNVKTNTNTYITANSGRSIHRIPGTNLLSYLQKNNENWEVWELNPETYARKKITDIGNNQDVCWLPNGELLIAANNKIIKYNPNTKNESIFYTLKIKPFQSITRMAVNAAGNKFALVAE